MLKSPVPVPEKPSDEESHKPLNESLNGIERTASAASVHSNLAAPAPQTISPVLWDLRKQMNARISELGDAHLERAQCKATCQDLEHKIQQAGHEFEKQSKNTNKLKMSLSELRPTTEDEEAIKIKIQSLENEISKLAEHLLRYVNQQRVSSVFPKLWCGKVAAAIEQMRVFSSERIKQLTEKFIMDVLVGLMDIRLVPGLDETMHRAYNDLQVFFSHHDRGFGVRLRQELTRVMPVPNESMMEAAKHLYGGLLDIYPSCDQMDLKREVEGLVHSAAEIGQAMKGLEIDIESLPTDETSDRLDPELMDDVDDKKSGTIILCIFPTFVAYDSLSDAGLETMRISDSSRTESDIQMTRTVLLRGKVLSSSDQ